jgi:uncharacterized heparinase superfamily protein
VSLDIKDRVRIALLAADRSRRGFLSHLLNSAPLRWRYGAPSAEQLLIVPQDLRTADPSFWHEVRSGQFGLAGTIATLDGRSPFELKPPNAGWARALHGFSWLRHLNAVDQKDAQDAARGLAVDWALHHRGGNGIAFEPAVMGRRLISWITHANFLLDDADQRTYDSITDSLGMQIIRLSAVWRDAPDGYPRLLALIALVLSDLAVAGHERRLATAEHALADEISRQILPDGGHISRNPGVLVELLLDLLPLTQCFVARGRVPPEAVVLAVRRMMPMVRLMRLGDGLLARFNGMGNASPAGLATVLAYDEEPSVALTKASASGYARLTQGETTVIADVGAPPPLEFAGEAHAGCLSFEMSVGTRLMFVNGGMPGPADSDWRAVSRATASHNTLTIADKSSSKLVRNKQLEALLGAPPIQLPSEVTAAVRETAEGLELDATHNGYLGRFGFVHHRRLVLEKSGQRLVGVDRLEHARHTKRLPDYPFAIHFHLHPDVVCQPANNASVVVLDLADGRHWRFLAQGASLSIEESTFFADSVGPRPSLQIVLRSKTVGESEVRWLVETEDASRNETGNKET